MEEESAFKKLLPSALKAFAVSAPCDVYVVGGFVRNFFCGLGETDIDLCGALPPAGLGVEYRTVSEELGTALLYIEGGVYEYTPLRTERYCGGGHIPCRVEFIDDVGSDARRRDFTAGSIYFDIRGERFIDPLGGITDARRKSLRSADPEYTFKSDGLRLMRLARIAAQTGFDIDADTMAAARNNAALLKCISPERVQKELNYILTADLKYGVADAHYRGLKLMTRLGLWNYCLPEIASMENFPQNPKYHRYDVMEHTFQAVRFAVPRVRLAALFHDVAKPYCQQRDGNMHLHHIESAAAARRALTRLKYPTAAVDFVERLCALHMYDLKGNTSEAKVRLFVADNMDIADDLVELICADGRATGMEYPERVHRFTLVKERLIEEGAPYELSALKIKGDFLAEMGYRGPEIGRELEQLRRNCILEPRLNQAEWLSRQALADLRSLRADASF